MGREPGQSDGDAPSDRRTAGHAVNQASHAAIEQLVLEFAARQHGLVTRAQLLGAGLGPGAVKYRVRAKQLRVVQAGVYHVGPLVSRLEREMAAALACGGGAVISHRSAAWLWHLVIGRDDRASTRRICDAAPGPRRHEAARPNPRAPARRDAGVAPGPVREEEQAPVDVMVRSTNRRRRPAIRLHRSGDLEADEVTSLDGIPITTVARTLLDLAAVSGSRELEQAVARAERHELVNADEIWRLMARHPKHRGVPALKVLVPGNGEPALARSAAEEQLLALVRKAQLPKPETNARAAGIEVDFVWRAERLVVEVDGFAFHSSARRFELDRSRDARLVARGFQVMRVTWRQLTREHDLVLVRLAQALTRRSGPRG